MIPLGSNRCSFTGIPTVMCAHCRQRFPDKDESIPLGRLVEGQMGLQLPSLDPLSRSGRALRAAAINSMTARRRNADGAGYYPPFSFKPARFIPDNNPNQDLRWCGGCKTVTPHTRTGPSINCDDCKKEWKRRNLL